MKHDEKKKIIAKYAVHAKDTGSASVQVAVLTERINALQSHLVDHPKDNHSRKGLLDLVGKRRRHLSYLKLHDKNAYEDLAVKLKLKKLVPKATRKSVKRIVKKVAPKVTAKKIAKKPAKKAAPKKPEASKKKAPAVKKEAAKK